MKALKHSPEHVLKKFRDDEVVVPYEMMTSLQVHVRGYVYGFDEKTGLVRGYNCDVRRGHGKETFYKHIGNVRSEREVETVCNTIYMHYIIGPKYNADGTPYEPMEKTTFRDSRKARPVVEPKAEAAKEAEVCPPEPISST